MLHVVHKKYICCFSLNFSEADIGMNMYVPLILKQVLPEEINIEVKEAGQGEEEDRQLVILDTRPTENKVYHDYAEECRMHYSCLNLGEFAGLSPNSQSTDWLMVSGR